VYVERNNEASTCSYCCSGKAISITYCEYVLVALGTQLEMRILHIVICGLLGSTLLFHIIPQTTMFQGKSLLKMKCVFWFYLQMLSVIFLIIRRNKRDRIKNVYWYSCKVLVIHVRFLWNLNLLNRFWKKPQNPNFMKIRLVGAEFFHVDRRTWRSQ
jgi:hypothetical protein